MVILPATSSALTAGLVLKAHLITVSPPRPLPVLMPLILVLMLLTLVLMLLTPALPPLTHLPSPRLLLMLTVQTLLAKLLPPYKLVPHPPKAVFLQ
jgi:hypothetical protein